MKAERLLDRRIVIADGAFVEIAWWRVPNPLQGCAHAFKFRMAYVVDGACVLRYDNETGKGDHRHEGGNESAIVFRSQRQMLADFANDVKRWNHENGRA
ncbi:MAG: DUF6516 family protein [Candidatus Accumulibacter sp.]|jgi:hypothetical protein|nr:DUF6516 family protein [Accumulibacter sp.]